MSLISTSIPNLVNGVSQQPMALRLSSQCELQENAYSSVVEGLKKRPPTVHRAKIVNAPTGNVFAHLINRDTTERYEVIIGGGDLRVYDLKTGVEKTVAFPNGKSYLASSNPTLGFRAVTVADHTFILNTGITVEQDSTTSPVRPPEAVVWIRQPAYGTTYTIRLAGVEYSFKTVDGDMSTDDRPSGVTTEADRIGTDFIATELRDLILAAVGSTFSVGRIGSTLHIKRLDEADFAIETKDSQGDDAMVLLKGKTQRFSNLPARAPDGFRLEVVGDQTTTFDNYYVTHQDSASTVAGVWVEAMKGGEAIRIKRSTMPHVLVREATGDFTFKQIVWEDRKVGDLEGNPMPSFVGSKITDVFFHRNRLGFLADENVVLSRAGDFYNFFRASATQVLDSDPIDVAVSHVKVSLLKHAVPFNETLLLFSDQTQFQLKATDMLSPKTVAINQTTEFECSLKAKPVGAGRFVYFAVNRGGFTGIREYYVDDQLATNDASEVTSHVPKYIPGDVTTLSVSTNEDVLVALSSLKRNELYVYKYYWNGEEKLQSSWSKWVFPSGDTILSAEFVESELWLVVRRSDGVYLESMALNPGAFDASMGFNVHLDRKVTELTAPVSNFVDPNDGTSITTIEIPYDISTGTYQLISGVGNPKYKKGSVIPYTRVGNVLTVKGDLFSFFFGRVYTMKYRFSQWMIREDRGDGAQASVGDGRLQIRKALLVYDQTGYFKVAVTPFRRDPYEYVFSGRVVGSAQNDIGDIPLEAGKFSFPVMAKSDGVTIDITSDSYLPCSLLSAEWEGLYVIRSRRL